MGFTALVLILILLVWYYGHSLKAISEVDARIKSALLTEFVGIKESVAQVAKNISDIERRLAEIDTDARWAAHSADVEWKFFNEQKIDPMLEKLDQVGADLSSSLDGIEVELGRIESSVDAIAAHPAFTWSKDED